MNKFSKKLVLSLIVSILFSITVKSLENNTSLYSYLKEYYLSSFAIKITEKELALAINPLTGKFSAQKLKEIVTKKFSLPRKKTEIVLNLFDIEEKAHQNNKKPCQTSESLIENLEILCGQQIPSKHLVSKIKGKNRTIVGTVAIAEMLLKPTTKIKELKRRQRIVRELSKNKALLEKLKSTLDEYRSVEPLLLQFWEEKSFSKLFSDDFYYPFFPLSLVIKMIPKKVSNSLFPNSATDWLNEGRVKMEMLTLFNNWTSLNFVYRSLKRLIFLEFPHLFKQFGQQKYFDSAYTAGEIISKGNTIKTVLKREYKKLKIIKEAQSKLEKAAQLINSILEIKEVINKSSVLTDNLRCLDKISYLFDGTSSNIEEFDKLLENLKSENFKENKSLIFRLIATRGEILSTAYLMSKTQYKLADFLKILGQIDAYLAIAELYKNSDNQNVKYCFPKYIKQKNPYIFLKKFWNPFISKKKVITNDIELGGNNKERNVVISGPNAGGKSTVLKSIIINTLMAQTVGIAPAKEFYLTPFYYIDAYLNITDKISEEKSSFTAEVQRSESMISKISKGKKSLAIIDEMFKGTNPTDGEAASYAVSKHLANYKNSIVLIASHFSRMTDLEKDTGGIFKNYKVTTERNLKNNSFSYPFKLVTGKTSPEESVALDILERENFPKEVVADARRIAMTLK